MQHTHSPTQTELRQFRLDQLSQALCMYTALSFVRTVLRFQSSQCLRLVRKRQLLSSSGILLPSDILEAGLLDWRLVTWLNTSQEEITEWWSDWKHCRYVKYVDCRSPSLQTGALSKAARFWRYLGIPPSFSCSMSGTHNWCVGWNFPYPSSSVPHSSSSLTSLLPHHSQISVMYCLKKLHTLTVLSQNILGHRTGESNTDHHTSSTARDNQDMSL